MEPRRPGLGVVYVPGLEPLLESAGTGIDWIEIEPQTLWHFVEDASNPYVFPASTLDHLKALPQRKIVHSVGNAAGGTQAPSPVFLDALTSTIRELNAPWASEHLSFTQFGAGGHPVDTSFMLPPLQTSEGVRRAARTIRTIAEHLPVPFAVETGVNYLRPRPGEIGDGEFVSRVVRAADCGILLDLHNIWTNERNGRQSVDAFLNAIPLDRVWEIHLAGGFEFDGYWLDSHSGAVPEPILEITERLIPRLPKLKAVVFEVFPSFLALFGVDAVARQLEQIGTLCARANEPESDLAPSMFVPDIERATAEQERPGLTPEGWETTLGELIVDGQSSGPLAAELSADPGIALIRKLVWRFRAGSIVKTLAMLTRLIQLEGGNQCLERLLDGYFQQSRPRPFASQEASGFLQYLQTHGPEIPYLDDVIAYERRLMQAILEHEPQYLDFSYDPRMLFQALVDGQVPATLAQGSYELEITP